MQKNKHQEKLFYCTITKQGINSLKAISRSTYYEQICFFTIFVTFAKITNIKTVYLSFSP